MIWADRRRSGPSCVLPKGVPHVQTENGGIVLADICWATSAQRRCHPKEALYLPTFSHLLIVNKLRSLSLFLSLAANAGPRVPSGGVTLKRRCTYRPSVTYLIVNKLLSLSLSLSLSLRPPEFVIKYSVQNDSSAYNCSPPIPDPPNCHPQHPPVSAKACHMVKRRVGV